MTSSASLDWGVVARNVTTALVGPPTRTTSTDWRFCRRGSLLVSISGKQAGHAGPTYGLYSVPGDYRFGCLSTATEVDQ